jgi:uncharacterized repeat protein (TIGR03843 family)
VKDGRFPGTQEFFKATPQTHTIADLCALICSPIVQCGLIPWGSNYTFLVTMDVGQAAPLLGVYKPRRGEAPLWDFPDGTLYKREYASFLLSEALGWRIVPPTVIREGPKGIGTVQLYMHHRPEEADYFALREQHASTLKTIAVFDFIAHNTDRKAGHCLRDVDGHVWGIDHGLTFNLHSGLRTVIWDFGGERISKQMVQDIKRVHADLAARQGLASNLQKLLSSAEIEALIERMSVLLARPILPEVRSRRSVPWSFY